MGQARFPDRAGLGEAGWGCAMQRGAGDDDVRPGDPVMAVGDHQIESPQIHARILHLHHLPAEPPQRRAHGRAHAAAADH